MPQMPPLCPQILPPSGTREAEPSTHTRRPPGCMSEWPVECVRSQVSPIDTFERRPDIMSA